MEYEIKKKIHITCPHCEKAIESEIEIELEIEDKKKNKKTDEKKSKPKKSKPKTVSYTHLTLPTILLV